VGEGDSDSESGEEGDGEPGDKCDDVVGKEDERDGDESEEDECDGGKGEKGETKPGGSESEEDSKNEEDEGGEHEAPTRKEGSSRSHPTKQANQVTSKNHVTRKRQNSIQEGQGNDNEEGPLVAKKVKMVTFDKSPAKFKKASEKPPPTSKKPPTKSGPSAAKPMPRSKSVIQDVPLMAIVVMPSKSTAAKRSSLLTDEDVLPAKKKQKMNGPTPAETVLEKCPLCGR